MEHLVNLPSRLHHTAYVTSDLEAIRQFYEDTLGLPLIATWCEKDMLFVAERTYCHVFFGLTDGSALAFFEFVNPKDQEQFGPKMPFTPFHHIALNVGTETQAIIEDRLAIAGYIEPQYFVLEHGYCRSVYVTDPNGMIVEFTSDHSDVDRINQDQKETAHAELAMFLTICTVKLTLPRLSNYGMNKSVKIPKSMTEKFAEFTVLTDVIGSWGLCYRAATHLGLFSWQEGV